MTESVQLPAVEARGLYQIYREAEVETVALRGAELVLQPGSWTSLMGPSGSGKSTLIHVLAGLLECPVRCVLSEPAAARLGACTTPGARPDAVVELRRAAVQGTTGG